MQGFVRVACHTCFNVDHCDRDDTVESCDEWGASNEACSACQYDPGDDGAMRHPDEISETTIIMAGVEYCIYCRKD